MGTLPTAAAKKHGFLRVISGSGGGYLRLTKGKSMSIIDGRTVIGAGVIHFHRTARADTAGAPSIEFVYRPGTPGGLCSNYTSSGIEVALDTTVDSDVGGDTSFEIGGARYVVYYLFHRHNDLPDGKPFFAGTYSIVDG